MKRNSVGRIPRGLHCSVVALLLISVSAAQPNRPAPSSSNNSGDRNTPVFTFVGAYYPDGTFRTERTPTLTDKRTNGWSGEGGRVSVRPKEVPKFIDLHSRERVMEDYRPPAYATKKIHGRLLLAQLRDQFVTLVYGREKTLAMPRHITMDSRGRMIVSDPGVGAVHVLDGENSFRIAAGPKYRLHSPTGVAVDAQDNIYVADADQGLIVVFDSNGVFLRNLGKIQDETLFHAPMAIAVDRQNKRLYLADTPRDAIFILDLDGNILARLGSGRGHGLGRSAMHLLPLEMNGPTAIALGEDRLAVLDDSASRVRVLDLKFKVVSDFRIPAITEPPDLNEIGIALDSNGTVYVSHGIDSRVRAYDSTGELVSTLGNSGSHMREFDEPGGLWMDSAGKLYVADTKNSRIQVFQTSAGEKEARKDQVAIHSAETGTWATELH